MSLTPSGNPQNKLGGPNMRGNRSIEIKAGEPCMVCHGVLIFNDAMRRRAIVPSCIGFTKIRVFDQPVKMDANYIAPSDPPTPSLSTPAPHSRGGLGGEIANPPGVHMAMYGIGETVYTARLLDAGVFPMVTRGACLLAESPAADADAYDLDDDDDDYDDDDDWDFFDDEDDAEEEEEEGGGGWSGSSADGAASSRTGVHSPPSAPAAPKMPPSGTTFNPTPNPSAAASGRPGAVQDGGSAAPWGGLRAGSGYNNAGDAISGDRLIKGAADVAQGLGRAMIMTAKLSWACAPLRARMQRDVQGFRSLVAATAARIPRDLRKLLGRIAEQ